MLELVKLLIKNHKTISVMESCTGGGFSNAITNIPNASKVLSFSAVTYSNEYKIKMGVSLELINKYTVYSQEVAMDMAKAITKYTNSNYGIGITGKLMKIDENNLYGENNLVYYSIYDKDNDLYYNGNVYVTLKNRQDNKQEVINQIVNKILEIIDKNY